jgi:hypothetical protein
MTTLSKCCSAPIKVAGGKEGTNWYECEKCGKTPGEVERQLEENANIPTCANEYKTWRPQETWIGGEGGDL